MDIEKSPQETTKKLLNIVKIMFHMMMKRSKIITMDLHMLLKRGKLASKAICNHLIMLHHHHHHHNHRRVNYYSALTCHRSSDINTSFISPRDYEFSCSNTPLYHKRKNHHRQSEDHLIAMHKVLDVLSKYEKSSSSSPVRQLTVTDSPEERSCGGQVDKDAEEFINKFYKDLMNQKRIAALESPSPYHHLWV